MFVARGNYAFRVLFTVLLSRIIDGLDFVSVATCVLPRVHILIATFAFFNSFFFLSTSARKTNRLVIVPTDDPSDISDPLTIETARNIEDTVSFNDPVTLYPQTQRLHAYIAKKGKSISEGNKEYRR